MKKQHARVLLTYTCIFTLYLLMAACEASPGQPNTESSAPASRITIQGETDQEVLQTIEIDNCDGKAELSRAEQRAQVVSVAVSEQIATTLGVSAEVISAEVQAAVGVVETAENTRSTEITLRAPPRTRMIFQLAWLGKEQLGVAENVQGWTIPIAFKRFVPTDVRIKSQDDIGCPSSDTGSPSITTDPVAPPPVSAPSTASTLCPYGIKRLDVESWKIGVADVSTVQAYIRQFDAMRPGDGGAYRQGITIPSGLLLATNFDENDATLWQTLPVIPIVHSGSWGLWETTGSFVAPNRGACMVITP